MVPMSTASAVLRLLEFAIGIFYDNGTYVYCFGGIETYFRLFLKKPKRWYLCLLLRRY